jgi:hypothetical protein
LYGKFFVHVVNFLLQKATLSRALPARTVRERLFADRSGRRWHEDALHRLSTFNYT